ncbi:MAG: RHS repeat-associated core domain-containing protein, partial [Endozoicomonadaceae bacterium]|nr:RHS repeat-associated core domain-containing protein [Endozoicomonadaceae bacterium]
YNVNGQPDTIITPAGHHFSWQYNLLGLPVDKFTDGKLQWHADYDTITKRLIKKTGGTNSTVYYYTADGLLKQLIHTSKNSYPDYQLEWQYDSNRRLTSVADISGNKTVSRYDALGRIIATDYQSVTGNHETLSSVSYDQFSRIRHLHYGSGMERIIEYDQWGHQKDIIDQMSGKLINHWTFYYDLENNIITLQQQTGQDEQAVLHYRYDTLNNLITMHCTGSAGLPLCPRDTAFSGSEFRQAPIIVRQSYFFTPLNRMGQVKEIVQNKIQQKTSIKIMHYQYTNPYVPLQLQQISIAWGQNRPVIQKLYYDKAGNMIIDGEDNHISYNAFNQITQVVSTSGKQSCYSYDRNGKEIMEKDDTHTGYLFYRGGSLINEQIVTAESGSHRVGYQGVARIIDDKISEYYENSYKGDVVSIFSKADNGRYRIRQMNLYSPYGMVWHKNKTSSELYKQTFKEFDGERTDPFTGWQFLSAGHRTYNPKQRYFVSEDPAGDGYAFGSNNPIMNTDPSGNMPCWLGSTLQWASNISTFGLSALHKKWANITAAVIGSGLCVVTLGASLLTGGSATMSAVLAGSVVAGSLPVASAAIPANKGFGIAASVTGLADLVINIAAGAAVAFFGAAAESLEGTATETEGLLCPKNSCELLTESTRKANNNTMRLPPGAAVSEIGSILRIHLIQSGFSRYIGEENDLILKDTNAVIYVWKWLRMSRFKCLTLCETATILMTARINDKSLSLDAFSNLMNLKNEAAKFSAGNSELQAYYEKLEEVLNSLSDNHTVISKKTEMNEEIFYTLNCIVPVGEYIVMCGDNDTSGTHITVLQRLNDEWQYCAFSNCGRIFARRSNLSAIYKKFFWSYKRNEPDIYFMLKLRDGFVDAVIPELT